MKCIGCDEETEPAAYAIMHQDTFLELGMAAALTGPVWPGNDQRRFAAAPVCGPCHRDPAHRKRLLKAHFATPAMVNVALAAAGSSTDVQG